jgi:ankyrin repeat protein
MSELQEEPAIFLLIRNTDVSIDAVRLYLQHYPSTLPLPIYENDTILTVAVKACFSVNTPEMFENGDMNAILLHQLSILKIVVDYVNIEEINNGQSIFHLLFQPPNDNQNDNEGVDELFSAILKLVSNSILDILLNHVNFSHESNILFLRNTESQLPLHMAIYHDNSKAARKLLEHMRISSVLYSDYEYIEPERTIPLLHYILMNCPSSKLITSTFSTFPNAASIGDSDGILPIAVALENSLPSRKIEVIIDMYTEAVSIPNGDGDLPLHLAAMDCPNRHDVLNLLIEQYDIALETPNRNGQLPLHCALEYQSNGHLAEPVNLETVKLLSNHLHSTIANKNDESEIMLHEEQVKNVSSTNTSMDFSPSSSITRYDSASQIVPYTDDEVEESFRSITSDIYMGSALLHKDSYGEIPLHIACRRLTVCSYEIISWLLECYPESAEVQNEFGHLPMHLLAASECHDAKDDVMNRCFDILFCAHPGAIYKNDDEGDIPLHCLLTHHHILPTMLNLFTKHILWIDESIPLIENPITGYLPLHTACRNGIYAGDILDKIIYLHPEASLHFDNEGYLPFHIALQAAYSCDVDILKKLLYQKEDQGRYRVYPTTTTLPCTANGVPALFVACENAIDLDCGDDDNFESNDCRTLDVIRFLVENSPELFISHNHEI